MHKKGMLILFKFLVIFTIIGKGQIDIVIPHDFIETTPPKPGDSLWVTLNYSSNEFEVKKINEQLEIGNFNKAKQCEFRLANGTLIGINKGERGGKLFFRPIDSAEKEIEITTGNVRFIFSFKNRIYFFEGLAHLGINRGALYELKINNKDFQVKKILDFNDAPEAFVILGDTFLVATHENFFIVKDFRKELIFKDAFWSSLYPNSIAAFDEKNVFIGIRGGIVKLDVSTKALQFYMYNKPGL